MDRLKNNKWSKLFGGAVLFIVFAAAIPALVSSISSQPSGTELSQQQTSQTVPQAVNNADQQVQQVAPTLSNNNYYTNSSGNSVHSPAYTNTGDIPAGATAQCGDGTYSFSQHRSGTCSYHGGVSQWLQ